MKRESESFLAKSHPAPNFNLQPFAMLLAALCLMAAKANALHAQTAPLDLFVSSRNTNSVKCYHGLTGAYLGDFVKPGADVRKFDKRGKFLGVFTEEGRLRGAVNLWFGGNGDLFVVDWMLGSVLRFEGQTGRFKSNFIAGMQNTEGFVFGPDSTLYLCDWSRNTVTRYDSSGRLLGIFASDGDMRAPNSVIFGPPLKKPM